MGRQHKSHWLDSNRVLTVRLVTTELWPKHGTAEKVGVKWSAWKDWRGSEITIFAAPQEPRPGDWNCGTAQVWRVTPATVARVHPGLADDTKLYVCEHHIEFLPAAELA